MTGDSPSTPTDDIMCATYRALCRHGYADLTMQDIADEWEKSKPALHYHYDTKRGLLVAFLDHLFDSYTDRVADPEDGSPRERLHALVAAALDPPRADTTRFHDEIRGVVGSGVDSGAFRADVDPDETATLLVTLVNGAHSRRIVLGDDAGVPEAIRSFVADTLVADREGTTDR
mgnify:CR=1 FL=1